MYSLKKLYKIGNGPSSSHTIGPMMAAKEFLRRYPEIDFVQVILYGSLALTGRGHLTDYILEKTILPLPCKIELDYHKQTPHPNTLEFFGYKNNKMIAHLVFYSVGGGEIEVEGEKPPLEEHIYPLNTYKEIAEYCNKNKMSLVEYINSIESLDDYLEEIYQAMISSVERGIQTDGVLPGKLQVKRKSSYIYHQKREETEWDAQRRRVMAYAYATSEENASGGAIVTAPTCGAAGVLPACLCYALELKKYSHQQIIDALKVAGLIGNIVKTNGSISGAEAGCQAEVGTACAMAAAFLASLDNLGMNSIERASEIALEHHLGLTCDPVDGYVQIPCIERNAVAALRAIDASKLASYLNSNDSKISFDLVVATMLDTGQDLQASYRETSEGGLAKNFH